MRPRDPNRPTLDPHAYLLEHGSAKFADRLRDEAGYSIQRRTLLALAEAFESRKPLLVEGPRGSGKSSLVQAVTRGFNLDHYHLQCMEGLTLADILFEWDREEQRGAPPHERFTRPYLLLGEVAAAFDAADREDVAPVLQIDELDKMSLRNQETLLQIFQDGFCDVPRLRPNGRVGLLTPGKRPPYALWTSNAREDEISVPLRSRACYEWIDSPTAEEEVRILRVQVPEASHDLLLNVIRALNFIRGLGNVVDKPELREAIQLLRELHRKGARALDEETIERHVCHIAKRRTDLLNLLEAAARIAREASRPHPKIDSLVAKALADDGIRKVA